MRRQFECKRCERVWETELPDPKACRWCGSKLWREERRHAPGQGRPRKHNGGAEHEEDVGRGEERLGLDRSDSHFVGGDIDLGDVAPTVVVGDLKARLGLRVAAEVEAGPELPAGKIWVEDAAAKYRVPVGKIKEAARMSRKASGLVEVAPDWVAVNKEWIEARREVEA